MATAYATHEVLEVLRGLPGETERALYDAIQMQMEKMVRRERVLLKRRTIVLSGKTYPGYCGLKIKAWYRIHQKGLVVYKIQLEKVIAFYKK